MTFENSYSNPPPSLHLDIDHMESMHASAEEIEAAQAAGLEFTPYFESDHYAEKMERRACRHISNDFGGVVPVALIMGVRRIFGIHADVPKPDFYANIPQHD